MQYANYSLILDQPATLCTFPAKVTPCNFKVSKPTERPSTMKVATSTSGSSGANPSVPVLDKKWMEIKVRSSTLGQYFQILQVFPNLTVLKIEIYENIQDFQQTINYWLPKMRALQKLKFSLKNSARIDNVSLALEGFVKCGPLRQIYFEGITSCPAAAEYHTLFKQLKARKPIIFSFKYVMNCDGFLIHYGM